MENKNSFVFSCVLHAVTRHRSPTPRVDSSDSSSAMCCRSNVQTRFTNNHQHFFIFFCTKIARLVIAVMFFSKDNFIEATFMMTWHWFMAPCDVVDGHRTSVLWKDQHFPKKIHWFNQWIFWSIDHVQYVFDLPIFRGTSYHQLL